MPSDLLDDGYGYWLQRPHRRLDFLCEWREKRDEGTRTCGGAWAMLREEEMVEGWLSNWRQRQKNMTMHSRGVMVEGHGSAPVI